ncbi:RHS repeat domain-containing protein [Streptacidiphilus sp. P02-A3a]|uniref:RHS repeat domain-containing protein n=1 Tax=Streptacidiphilus sp. P02-A3a TaxID=2704468 RepID=UPI0015F93F5C|nr:RHS repeat domain-containing protein [Streptacidiphilus sp. P02-A3a]QMU70257.1 RHS repeat protein [Streptacidiphilus sp. P02-A3a]QMU70285.1 RHS repeat protein [Streptacidiphilus sp. P02-A3a]
MAAAGSIGDDWFADYDRTLDTAVSGHITSYGPGGELLTFTQSGSTYTNAVGYHAGLAKNSNGTYTLDHTDTGSKDTYNSAGNLTAVTDHNGDAINVTQTVTSGQVTGFKATDARSGRWISLAATGSGTLTATDNSGRTVGCALAGSLSAGTATLTVTDTTGAATVYAYDTSGRVDKVTTPTGEQTTFGYDGQDRITSLTRVTNTATGAGDTWDYAYSATTRGGSGTTTVTDPNGHKTLYTTDSGGEVTKTLDALGDARASSYNADHDQMTAVNAQGTGAAVRLVRFDGHPRSGVTAPEGCPSWKAWGRRSLGRGGRSRRSVSSRSRNVLGQ